MHHVFPPAGNTVFIKYIFEKAVGAVALVRKRVLCAHCHIPGPGRQSSSSPSLSDSRCLKSLQEDTPQLMRTRSDVGVRRRGNVRTPSDQRRIRRHRFSINGHFYNHKVEAIGWQGARASPSGGKTPSWAAATSGLQTPGKPLSLWVMSGLQALLALREIRASGSGALLDDGVVGKNGVQEDGHVPGLG